MKRIVKKKQSNKSKIRNATKLEVNGVKFRSKLEAFTYSKLLDAGITDFDYEKVKFVLQEAFEYPYESYEAFERKKEGANNKFYDDVDHDIRSMSYLPDFTRINTDTKEGWILEVKGYSNDALRI